jgi:hypothetical protein
MASPYRFDADPYKDIDGAKSRTGLNAVTAGGATSGGEGYRRSALLPGARGYVAPTFGGAPRTDYVAPVAPVADDPDDEPAAPAPPPVAPAPAAAPVAARMDEQAGEGVESGISDGGPPGDARALLGDFDINGASVGKFGGAAIGSLVGGPVGGLIGAGLGYLAGRAYDGSSGGVGEGPGAMGDSANAQSGASENSAANSGAAQSGNMMGDGTFAEGGWVPRDFKGQAMMGKTGGLGAVTAGKAGAMPGYQAGGTVDALAGPNPPGPDDGFAALDQGEFVVKQSQAQRPDYAPVLEKMNQGTYQPNADGGGMDDDLDLDMGAPGNYPPSTAESATPDDMMQRLAMMPPEQSQALSGALQDPMLMSALFALLGPSFMGVMSALQGQQAPGMGGGGMQPPGMLAVSPDRAGMRPPGGGLGAVNA